MLSSRESTEEKWYPHPLTLRPPQAEKTLVLRISRGSNFGLLGMIERSVE